MRTLSTTILTGVALLYATGAVGAQTKTIEGGSISATVTIEAIEPASRTLTVRDAAGIHETIQVPPEIKRFSELKVGDKITARYYENVVIRLKKPNEAAVDVDSAAVTAGTGKRPAGTAARQQTITVAVTAIDPKTSIATVTGPNGYKYSRKVEDKKVLAQLKVGDKLDLTWTDALLISVESAK